tara:strand:- start:412 stop:699 length:288 start_codon:yes stop_codon:yes gene_type:complete
MNEQEYHEKYPFQEASSEDYDKELTTQITFRYPEVLRKRMMGDYLEFQHDEESTYVETSGEWSNAGMFVVRGKRYSDMELYESAVAFFELQIDGL